jgi:CheY-like chemotaxis protein
MEKHVIMVVDDDPDIIEVTTAFLVKRGFEVVAANHGREALQILHKKLPSLILVDVLMPEMDGFTFYKELKKDVAACNIPVLVVTGRKKMAEAFEVVGVDGFITKPFTPQQLIEKVEHILHITTSPADQGIHAGPQPKKVLCISDERIVLVKMGICGKNAGIPVWMAVTLGEAMAHCLKLIPDVIWLDVHFQDYPAPALVSVIRRLPQMEKKPIIGFSYFDTVQMDQPDVRQKVLKTDEISRGMMRAGATQYAGRYQDQLFLETHAKFLVQDGVKS